MMSSRRSVWCASRPVLAAASTAVCVLSLSACGAPGEVDVDGAPRGSAISPIVSEMTGSPPNHAEFTRNVYETDTALARASYTIPQVVPSACAAVMVGPNVLMSASHCGGNTNPGWGARFRVYHGTTFTDETFGCTWFMHTLGDSDMALFYCGPNANGENPGDKYGYLDFDTSSVYPNQNVITLWRNAIPSPDGATVPMGSVLFSRGRVISAQDPPAVVGSIFGSGYPSPVSGPPSRVRVQRYSEAGQSGAITINPVNRRILIGPTSTANYNSAGINGTYADSVPMQQYLAYARQPLAGTGYVPPPPTPGWSPVPSFPVQMLNVPFLNAFGQNIYAYFNRPIDNDADQFIDVQELIEDVRGENRRKVYWLGFESRRRNRLWIRSGDVLTFDQDNEWLHASSALAGYRDLFRHDRLNLQPGATYTVRFHQWTASAAASTMYAGFYDPAVGYLYPAGYYYPTNTGAGWVLQSLQITVPTAAAAPALVFGSFGAADIYVANLSVTQHAADGTATNTFDSAGERHPWRSPTTGPAVVVPDARTVGVVNWVGKVNYTPGVFTLENYHLPIQPGRNATICFKSALDVYSNGFAMARAILTTDTGDHVLSDFSPGQFYQQLCVSAPAAWLTSARNGLRFGYQPNAAIVYPSQVASYFVDDVSVRQ